MRSRRKERSVDAKEWWKREREQVMKKEFAEDVHNMYADCLKRVYVRRTREEMAEVISVEEALPNTDLVEMREFYCPGCYAQLGVEVVPVGYPVLFEMLPDLDAKLSCAYVMNKMNADLMGDRRSAGLGAALYAAL